MNIPKTNIYINNKTNISDSKEKTLTTFKSNEKIVAAAATPAVLTAIAAYNLINVKRQNVELENCLKHANSDNFLKYKNNVIAYIKNNQYDKYDREGDNIVEYLQSANDFKTFNDELEYYISRVTQELSYKELETLQSYDLSIADKNKIIFDSECKNSELVIPLLKLLAKKDENPEVVKIKNKLEEKYGKNLFYMNNNLEFAKACETVFDILEKNKIPTKQIKNIISTNIDDFPGICMITREGSVPIVNPDNWQVENAAYTLLHEILHTLQPKDIEFRLKKIPRKYQNVADNVSSYAKGNFAHEVHCELYVKKLLSGLSQQEEELFNYLGGNFT